MHITSERAERERQQHNEGLRRERYERVLSYARHYFDAHQERIRDRILRRAEGGSVLEIGSSTWRHWLEGRGIRPDSLDCINISERELQTGVQAAEHSAIKPRFHLMDAHRLEFESAQFDVVFGGSILHHLDLPVALDEIQRVLKPDGVILFREPLAINPVAKLVRLLTPRARTVDEQPFRLRELREIERRFDVDYYFEQLTSVASGVVSRWLFDQAMNPLNLWAYKFDTTLVRLMPPLGVLYRVVMLAGTKRASGGALAR